jgi:hypothetical protein
MTCNACGKEHWVQVDYCYKSSVEIERDYLKAENARLRDALEWYADISVWGNGCAAIDPCDTYTCDRGVLRGGKHAIEALTGIKFTRYSVKGGE